MNKNESMNNKTKWIIALLSVLFIITFIVGYQYGEMRSEPTGTTDTLTVVEFDTIEMVRDTTIYKQVPKIIEKLRVDTVKKDTVLVTERKEYINECTNENDTAIIKTTIVGVNASLDSLSVLWKKRNIIQTNTITVTNTIKDKKKINVGIGVGYGYGLNNKQFEPFIGISLNYNL